MRQQRER